MFAGMPGTGIGGIFYMVLIVLMPFREVWLAARGRETRPRLKAVVTQFGLGLAVIGALWGEGIAIRYGFTHLRESFPNSSVFALTQFAPDSILIPAFSAAPFAILGAIALSVLVLRIVVRPRSVRSAG